MKKQFMAALLLATSLSFLGAQSVNENELRSAGTEDTVRFENYTGPHAVIESIAAIRAIGTGMGNQVAKDVTKPISYTLNGKYTVIHCVDPSVKGKLDADIILINPSATVDHIKNLRRIIDAYLVAAYGYTEKDAATIATFVTVYNAVYRGKPDAFQAKYKNIVTDNLDDAKCGLSTKWSDWPGNSQIVIPLGDLDGGLSTVDTSVISDKKVVESMQEEDDKGVDERKNMVDIKERESEKAQEKAQDSAKKAAEESKKLDQQKQAQKDAESKANAAQKDADKAREEAAKNPTDQNKQAAADAQKQADQAKDNANREAEKTQAQQQKTDQAKEDARDAQAVADKKQSEAQNERTEIAKDQQKLIKDALAEKENKNTVIGLRITDAGKQMSGLVKVDSTNGNVVRESPVTVVRGRTVLPVKDVELPDEVVNVDPSLMYMAICGENVKNAAVKLCIIDGYKMEIQKESAEFVAEDSVLVENNGSYYCVIKSGENWVLGKYDQSVNLLLKSSVNLTTGTPVTVTEKGIIVTDKSGAIRLLSLTDLSPIAQGASAEK